MVKRRMTPQHWQSIIDRRIDEAQRRGEFDNLPGSGKPIPDLDRPHDPLWWVKKLIEREDLSVLLPQTLAVRAEVEQGLAHLPRMFMESEARQTIKRLNEKILRANSRVCEGPPSSLSLLDEAEVLARWRQLRGRPV